MEATCAATRGDCVQLANILRAPCRMSVMIDALKQQLATDGEITFRVKVRPQAPVSRFRGPLGLDTYKVDVAAVPEDGEANEALIEFLAQEFGVKKYQVVIVHGDTSRLKIIRISAS